MFSWRRTDGVRLVPLFFFMSLVFCICSCVAGFLLFCKIDKFGKICLGTVGSVGCGFGLGPLELEGMETERLLKWLIFFFLLFWQFGLPKIGLEFKV